MGIIILLHAFLLARESLSDRQTRYYLLSWIPLVVTVLIDIVDQFIPLAGEHYFMIGFIITLALQIVQLVFDLQRQYKEAIRYQQIQKELYEAKVTVMASQIRPHFMYNALTSIAMMCTIDPPTAQEATVTFAKYLRENMDSLKQNSPVPFEQELEHLKKYLYIEKLRFADKLNIEYDITATDFRLPLISVQPLVENAVKHGVGMKKKGGTVKIATRETDCAYEVIISDDGVGFDPSSVNAGDGRSHVGMENTRTRLKEMCGGEVRIESQVGVGTVATIILPKELKQQ
jgi:sensor histidine kinase YesM